MVSKVNRPPLLLVVLSLSLLTGCIFSPERKPPTKVIPPTYLEPTDPKNVLENLISAYQDRDSVQTALVYDDAYVGSTNDPSAPTPIPDFTKNDEIRHVGRLKLDPNIVSVFLDFGSPNTWQVLDGNVSEPGTKIIPINSQTVRIEDISRATTWESQNQVIEYTFKPYNVPGAPAAEDTIWKVVRWTEIAN